MKKLSGKKYSDFNAMDLRQFWCTEYWKHYQEDYQPHGYGGNELKALKGLLAEEHDIFDILVAISRAIRMNVRDIKTFVGEFQEYVPRFGKIEFFVAWNGGVAEQNKLLELIVLDAKWFPSAEDDMNKRKLIAWFDSWIERTNGRV